MNALQSEFITLRAAGMKPREALNSMVMWRLTGAADLLNAAPVTPRSIVELATELSVEAERIRMTRRMVGVRP